MKNRYLPLLLCFFYFTISAQDHLQVVDPDQWWWPFGESGKIEEATITLEPKGLYTEVGLYLTISDEGLDYPEGMELEIVLDFNLPPGSIVHDSWLWMPDGSVIVKADVYDISKAIQTYEDIVDRNRDPSILYRKGNNNYQIRIFPLFGGESRKIKITYLSPNKWDSEAINTWIPTGIFNTSNEPLEHLKLIHIPDSKWTNPQLNGINGINFVEEEDPFFGPIEIAYISGDQLNLPISYTVDAPFVDNDYYVGKWGSDNDQFYQLAFIPPTVQEPISNQQFIFLLDYQEQNSNVTAEQLKAALIQKLSEFPVGHNKFTIGYSKSNGQIEFIHTDWLNLNPSYINSMVSDINLVSKDRTIQLLEAGIQYADNYNKPSDIVLISNATQFDYWEGPSLASGILENMDGPAHRIHVLDYQSKNFELVDHWPNAAMWTTEHLSFYKNLTISTNGHLSSVSEGALNIWNMLDELVSAFSFAPITYDLHTKMEQGFTFNKHQINRNNNIGPDRPILQIGKYSGEFPMEIEFSALDGQDFIYEETFVQESETITNDSLNREMWVGNQIRLMEGISVGNSDIQDIVKLSIDERVLSKHTAFLALDLENGGAICANCWEVGGGIIVIDVDEINAQEISLSAAPNPFTDFTQIKISTGNNNTELDPIQSMALFDSFGKLIQIFDDELAFNNSSEYIINWDGKDQNGHKLPGGIYHFRLATTSKVYSIKLVLISN